MSKEITLFDDMELPAYLRSAELDATTKALMGASTSSKRISIRGGVYRLLVNGKEVAINEDRTMNVVVVAAAESVSRTYYEGSYSEDAEVKGPTCWSDDSNNPAAAVQNPQSKRCIDCAQNKKGSGQGDSKACRFSQRLAVVLGNDIEGDVYQLTLPSMSVFGEGVLGKWPLQAYAKALGSKGVPITAVVTEMRFDTASATPKLTFKPIRALTEKEHKLIIAQGQSDEAKQAIAFNVYEQDSNKPKAELPFIEEEEDEEVIKPIKAKAKPAPVVEDDEDEEEIAEPVKVKSKATAKPQPPKTSVAEILDEWDD